MRILLVSFLLLLLCVSDAPQAQVPRAVYLAPYDGTGTEADPFRPRGLDSITGCIDHRPDETKAAGFAICGRSTLPAGADYIPLANSLDATMTGQQKAALVRALGGQAITASDIPSILAELLIDRATRKIRPGKDGKYHIWLGGQQEAWVTTAFLYDQWHIHDNGYVADLWNAMQPKLAWAATLATETFTGTDGDINGRTFVHPWVEDIGTGWTLVSNLARNETAGGTQLARLNVALDSDDFTVQATMVQLVRTGGGFARCGVAGRKPSGATDTYYRFLAERVANQWELYKVVTSTSTLLGSTATTPVDGDVMLLRMDGSSISGDVNGSSMVAPVTDAAISGNNYGGLYSNRNTTTMTCDVDNLNEADIPQGNFGVLKRRFS